MSRHKHPSLRLAAAGRVQDFERPRFAPLPMVAGVAAVTLLVLALLYPARDTLLRHLLDSDFRDEVAEQYLSNLLRDQPSDHGLRMRLAEQRLAQGKYQAALHVLEPLLGESTLVWRTRAERLAVEALERQFYEAEPATRGAIEARLRARLNWLSQNDDNPVILERLAKKALALGDPEIATNIFRRISTMTRQRPEWYAEAARVALAAGDYQTSADMYTAAQARAWTAAEKRRYFRAALQSLESGYMLHEAVALAAQAEVGFENEPELRIHLNRLYAQSTQSPARRVLGERLKTAVRTQLNAGPPAEVLEQLKGEAQTLGDGTLELEGVRRLAESKPIRDAVWFSNAAELALSQGEYRLSAQFLWEARRLASKPDVRRSYYLKAVRVLQSGNLLTEAITEAERELDDLGNDKEVLYTLATLARAANRPDIAEQYAKRLLRVGSDA